MRRRAFLEALPLTFLEAVPLTAHLLRGAQLNDASLWSPRATDSSILIVGNSLRPLLAAVSLSPAKFAYLSHTMGVCLAALAPLSSWVGIQLGYIVRCLATAAPSDSELNSLAPLVALHASHPIAPRPSAPHPLLHHAPSLHAPLLHAPSLREPRHPLAAC